MLMDRLQIIPLLAGSVLITLGCAVSIGWFWQLASLVEVLPGLAAMAFPTAVSFACAGVALVLRTLNPRSRFSQLLGAAIGAYAFFNLILLWSHPSFDVWRGLHAWFDQKNELHARMSIPTSIGFLLGGIAVSSSGNWRYSNRFAKLSGLLIVGIGMLAIVGYALALEPLYHGYVFRYVSVHTAIGMIFFGTALCFADHSILSRFQFSDGGVVAIALSVLVGTSLSIGLIFWVSVHSSLMTILSDGLGLAQRTRAEQIDTIIQLRSTRAATVADRPNLLNNMRELQTRRDTRENMRTILGVLRSYKPFGFSAIRVYGLNQREIVHDGTPIDSAELSIPLNERGIVIGRQGDTAELLWHNAFYLRHRMALSDNKGQLGFIVTEQPLPELDKAVLQIKDLNRSDELLLCAKQGERIACFPSTYQMHPFVLPRTATGYSILAMAATQSSSTVEAVNDYRNRHVVAAVGSVGATGLFTILNANTAVLYQPLLQQLQRTVVALLGLTALGTLLIYTRVRPLVLALRRSEQSLHAALRESNAARIAADDANHAKSLFLSSMSHELRTPLNGVLGYVQMLQDNPNTSSEQQRQLDAIESCGQHLLSLINDVLDLSKIESGRIDIVETNCSLYDLLESVSDIVRQRARNKGLQYSLDIDKSVPPFVRIDDVKLRQILVNLLGNAVKFTEHGSVALRVTTRMANRELLFQVRDTGIGIPAEKQQEIFQPFRQIGRSAGGTGLGLSISQRLCEAMGGMLLVQSRVGTGSCFSVNLPLVLGEAIKTIRQSHAMHPIIDIGSQKLTVLVVDDNAINRQVLASMLRANGISSDEAENGEEAIAAMRRQPYALVLMDVRMPVMDGLTATRAIRADPALRGAKVIVISASVSTETIAKLHAAGCDDFIKKPVRVRELLEKVARHLQLPLRETPANNHDAQYR